MVGFGAKGEITTVTATFSPDAGSDALARDIEVPMDGIVLGRSARGRGAAAQGQVNSGVPPHWTGEYPGLGVSEIRRLFLDHFLNKLRRWNECAETEDELTIEDQLHELSWSLLAPFGRGIGSDFREGYWKYVENYLAFDAPDQVYKFRQKLKELMIQTGKVDSESIEEQSCALRLFKLQVLELCGILVTLIGELQSHQFEIPTGIAAPTDAPCDPQSTDNSQDSLPDLTVDTARYKAIYNGVEYDLNAAQTALLAGIVAEKGDWFCASSVDTKPARVKKSLDPILQELIESKPGKGTRLKHP